MGLSKEELKEKWEALSPEEKKRAIEIMEKIELRPDQQAPIKEGVATLTYKQLAQNFNKEGQKFNVQSQIRQAVKNMNKMKKQIRVVNKPGSTLHSEEGTFMITKKGKSIRIGD